MKQGVKTSFFKKERLITSLNNEDSRKIKEILKIPEKEKILIVLDDSLLKNLKQLVVFTDKNIYWNINNAVFRLKTEDSETKTRGEGSIINKSLNDVSIFSRNIKELMVVYLISENVQLMIPFSNFNNESSLTLLFYEHVTNYGGKYRPNNTANEKIFSSLSQSNEIVSISMASVVFNVMSYLMASLFLLNLVFGFFIVDNEIAVYTIVLLKASNIIFGNRKSMYFYLMLIILTPLMFSWINELGPLGYETLIYIIYSAVFIILGVFDFDKIFKYLVFILAIASLVLMVRNIFI